jgi:hypothetical protein
MTLFRRRIEIVSRQATGEARAVLEDDFHHFRVALTFAGGVVTSAAGTGVRVPYTACSNAGSQLDALVGMPLNSVSNSVTRATDASLQCTHMLDLAGLAIAAAARGIAQRRYDIEVPRRVDGETTGSIDCDGLRVLTWRIDTTTILAPPEHAGISLREGLARWALATLTEDQAEAALVLRRCLMISRGRERDLDLVAHANPSGNCYAQQVERAPTALRIVGSTHDYTDRADTLCAGDEAFLAFANR